MQNSVKNRLLRSLGHQHWLRGRDRILRLFAHPDRHPPMPFEVDFYGLRYSGSLNNFIDWSVFFYGAFEAHELELLGLLADALRLKGRPVNVFDVGSNVGHHTLYLSAHADHVYSFEPFEPVRNEMERKLQHAGVTNVSIFPVALGETNEMAQFHPPIGANQGTGTLSENLPGNSSANVILVPVARGDDYLAEQTLPPISLLKMDVEGFEKSVLRGLRQTLLRDRPPILMEILPSEDAQTTEEKFNSTFDLLYPDHLLFAVEEHRRRLVLRPFSDATTLEVLVLPAELAGIIPGTK